MAWQTFAIDQYEVYSVAYNSPGYPDIYAFIRLYWEDSPRATLWFYRNSATTIPSNASSTTGGITTYYGRYGQAALPDIVDLLRNEKPVFFQWSDATKSVFLPQARNRSEKASCHSGLGRGPDLCQAEEAERHRPVQKEAGRKIRPA